MYAATLLEVWECAKGLAIVLLKSPQMFIPNGSTIRYTQHRNVVDHSNAMGGFLREGGILWVPPLYPPYYN